MLTLTLRAMRGMRATSRTQLTRLDSTNQTLTCSLGWSRDTHGVRNPGHEKTRSGRSW